MNRHQPARGPSGHHVRVLSFDCHEGDHDVAPRLAPAPDLLDQVMSAHALVMEGGASD